MTARAEREGFDVLICTGDRDALQLVSDRVTVLYPRKGVSDMWRFTPESVQEKYGLSPAQYPDFAALRGDPSDNLPNIPSVGEKTATKWIVEFGDLDQLVARVDEVKGKAGDALRAHLAQVVQNRQLTELVRDVPIEVMPGDLVRTNWERDEVHRVFDALEFRVLRDRLYQTVEAATPEADEGFEVTFTLLGARPGRALARCARPRRRRADRRTHLGVLGRRQRRRHRRRARDRRRGGRLVRPRGPRPGGRAGGRRLAGRRVRAQGAARREGSVARVRRPRLGPARRHQRHRAVGVPRDARPAQLRPRRPRAALPAPRAAGRGGDDGGQLAFGLDGGDDTAAAESDVLRARAVLELADALDTELANKEATALLRDLELPLVRVLAGWSAPASRSTPSTWPASSRSSAVRSRRRPTRPSR